MTGVTDCETHFFLKVANESFKVRVRQLKSHKKRAINVENS